MRVNQFERPLHAADAPTERIPHTRKGRERPCSCDRSPWCRGQASKVWESCSTGCAACAPTPYRAPTRTPVVVDHLNGREGEHA